MPLYVAISLSTALCVRCRLQTSSIVRSTSAVCAHKSLMTCMSWSLPDGSHLRATLFQIACTRGVATRSGFQAGMSQCPVLYQLCLAAARCEKQTQPSAPAGPLQTKLTVETDSATQRWTCSVTEWWPNRRSFRPTRRTSRTINNDRSRRRATGELLVWGVHGGEWESDALI